MELQKKLGIAGGVVCLMAIAFGWVAFPILLKSQVNAAKVLKEGSEMRDIWIELPFPIQFEIYLFNITNPVGIENGEKPIVDEIGPYFYDEYKEKVDLVDREEDDTVEYSQRVTWHFNPSKSNGLTGDEELIFPHLAMLGMMLFTVADKPTMVGMAAKAVDSIYKKPTSIFVKVKARDIMFDGLPIDCTVKDFAGSAACTLLKSKAKDFVLVGDNLYKISLFGHKNGTVNPERMRVIRGLKNPKDVGHLLEWNNQSVQTIWAGEPCNSYNGTDSTIFHSFLYENEDVVSFFPEVCRSFMARYQSSTVIEGIRANHYTADFGDQSTIPEQKCFCPTPETCLKKGAMDLLKCVGSPIVTTLPHFYLTDPSYSESVSGLHPVQEDHEIFLDFEPLTGTPVRAWKRLQFNVFIFPIEKFRLMKNFPNALLPLFWVAEGLELNDDFMNQLKAVFRTITFVRYLKWTLLLLGLGMAGIAGGLEFKRRQDEKKSEITPMPEFVASGTISQNSTAEVKRWAMKIWTSQSAAVPVPLGRNLN